MPIRPLHFAAALFCLTAAPLAASRDKSAPAAVSPADAAATAAAAQAAYQRGELSSASKLFESAVAQQPDNPAQAYNAALFFFQTGNYGKSENYLKRVLKLNPDYAMAFFYLGLIAEKKGDYNKAVNLYSDAARRDRRVLDAAYNKEIVQSRLTMDVRLRRYAEGDKPLDFVAVASAPAPAPVAAKPEPAPPAKPAPAERPKSNPAPRATAVNPVTVPAARSAPKPDPAPASEIRIESPHSPDAGVSGDASGASRGRPMPVSPMKPAAPPVENTPTTGGDRTPPPVNGPNTELPEIDNY